jgi:predicted nucleic-acid-binding protein
VGRKTSMPFAAELLRNMRGKSPSMKPERVFADTNLFLRYLTNDVPAQADAVSSLLEQAERGELVLVTNALVMAEIVWTLDSYYQLPKAEIEEKLLAVLNTPGLEVIDSDIVMQAVVQYVEKMWILSTPTMLLGCRDSD